MKKGGKATAALLPFLSLFGSGKAPKYTADAVRSVSITCGHMDYSHSYAFYLRKEADGWLLDADFAADSTQPHAVYEACAVTAADAEEILAIVREEDAIGKLQSRKKPKLKVQVADETTHYTSILFADGTQLGAATHISDDFVNDFYRLAEKYAVQN